MSRLLVVVDYQNDFVNGAIGFKGAELLDPKIVQKIKEYLENGDTVVYTMDTHFKDYLETREGKQLPIPHCIFNTDGWNLYGETGETLKDGVNSYKIIKTTFGISPENFVTGVLANQNFESIEFVGLVTNMCVISNVAVFQAAFPNSQMIVNSGLCASFDPDMHKSALKVMEGMQVQVIYEDAA